MGLAVRLPPAAPSLITRLPSNGGYRGNSVAHASRMTAKFRRHLIPRRQSWNTCTGQRRRTGSRGDRVRRTGAADQPRARRRLRAARRRAVAQRALPADPLPQARLGRKHAHPRHRSPSPTTPPTPLPCSTTSVSPAAHVIGHSSGAAVAAQLALDEPDRVATLVLLELSLFSVPSGEAFLAAAAPVFDAYASGDHEGALSMFLSAVSGLDWAACRTLLDERVPGASPRRSRTPTRSSASNSRAHRMDLRRRTTPRRFASRCSPSSAATPRRCGSRSPSSYATRRPTSRNAPSTASATCCTSKVPARRPADRRLPPTAARHLT